MSTTLQRVQSPCSWAKEINPHSQTLKLQIISCRGCPHIAPISRLYLSLSCRIEIALKLLLDHELEPCLSPILNDTLKWFTDVQSNIFIRFRTVSNLACILFNSIECLTLLARSILFQAS